MRVTAEYVMSVVQADQLPRESLPEIALVGRSNVGKSSLINALLGRSGLARTSKTPGCTQALNYYRVTPLAKAAPPFFLVDMPGYGFAAVSAAGRAQWSALIQGYLETREVLRGVVHLIDLRHPPQPLDHDMGRWLRDLKLQRAIVGTKADKVPRAQVPGLLLQIAEKLDVDSLDTLAFSAETGLGKDKLWHWIQNTLLGRTPADDSASP
jgi:GTP-binding protein